MNENFVLTKCDYFVEAQVWPLFETLNPRRWIANFGAEERSHAIHLLNAFLYYSEPLVNEMLKAAFQRLSQFVVPQGQSFLAAQTTWATFVDTLLVTHVTGEAPSPTDSGYTFARKARQVLGVPEERILSPQDVLTELLTGTPKPIVFVDDFVGSGEQFIKTWDRLYHMASGIDVSFRRIAALKRGLSFYYCPLLCTDRGLTRISDECPDVRLAPAHVLPARYSAIHPQSIIWPQDLLATAAAFVQETSRRAGIPDNNGGVNDWRGFNQLGLTVAFAHSIPDATLPIFYWEQNGWVPLIRRV